MDLTEFISARLDEDEAYAHYSGQWVETCEAMRAILAEYAKVSHGDTDYSDVWVAGLSMYADGWKAGLGVAVRNLAVIWHDHPDYDPAWAPAEQAAR